MEGGRPDLAEDALRGEPFVPEPEGPESRTLRHTLAVLHARRYAVAGAFLFVFGATAFFTFSATPIYRASALLLLEPKRLNIARVEEVYDPMFWAFSTYDYYRTRHELIRSRRVAEPVARALEVSARPEFEGAGDPVEAFRGGVRVEPVRDTRLARVSYESPDPAFACRAANAIARQFLEDTYARSAGASDLGLKKLIEREKELRPKYEAAVQALQQFKEEHELFGAGNQDGEATSLSALQTEWKWLSEERARAYAARAEVEGELVAAEEALQAGRPLRTLPSVQGSGDVAQTRVALAGVEQEKAALGDRFLAEHPLARALEARAKVLEERIRVGEEAAVAGIRARRAAAIAREEGIENEITRLAREVGTLGKQSARLKILQESAETVASSYKAVLQRTEEIQLSVSTDTRDDSLSLVEEAREPTAPIRPLRHLNLALGALVGLGAGLVLVLLLEALDQAVKSKEQVERLLARPLLGEVPPVTLRPETEAAPGFSTAVEFEALARPWSPVAEAFRTTLTALTFTLPQGARRALLVTSAGPQDGKTFVALNLALTLAKTGRRVLLVDADLRNPRVHRLFDEENPAEGFSTLLVGDSPGEFGELLRATSLPGLEFLPAGPPPPNPPDLLGSEAVRRFVEAACARYDWVVFDTPPAARLSDAATLLAQVQFGVFVVRAFATDRGSLRRAAEILRHVPGRLLGFVLNLADAPRNVSGGYGYYGYGYGYGYGAHRKAAESASTPEAAVSTAPPGNGSDDSA